MVHKAELNKISMDEVMLPTTIEGIEAMEKAEKKKQKKEEPEEEMGAL